MLSTHHDSLPSPNIRVSLCSGKPCFVRHPGFSLLAASNKPLLSNLLVMLIVFALTKRHPPLCWSHPALAPPPLYPFLVQEDGSPESRYLPLGWMQLKEVQCSAFSVFPHFMSWKLNPQSHMLIMVQGGLLSR
jgi:hypothetical protein